jgi:hypothetical protein
MILCVAMPSDKRRHLSADGRHTLCGLLVGYELSKSVWKKKPACLACNEKS